MTEQEKRERLEAKQHKRAKRAERALKNRGFKNFMLVFVGFLLGVVMLVSSVAIFVAVIPVKSYMELIGGDMEEPPVSENVQDKSLIEALMKVNTYQMKDVPVLKKVLDGLMNGSGLDSIITIDVNAEGFDNIKFIYDKEDGTTFVEEIQRYIKVSPSVLGETFAGLDVFKTREVPEEDVPTPTDMKGLNAKIFGYIASGSVAEGNAKFERAFTDDGKYVDGVNAQTKLYYLSISEMSLSDAMGCISDRFGVSTIRSIISCFSNLGEDDLVAKILKDTTVNKIGEISTTTILVKDIMGGEGGEDFYSLLESATGKNRDEATIDDIKNIDTSKVKLTSFLKGADVLYDVIVEATGIAKDELTVGSLESFSFDNVKLKSFLSSADDLYKILSDALNGKPEDEITIGDLSNVSVNTVKLSSVLDPNDASNKTVYDILVDATGKSAEEMTIGDMATLSVNEIRLSTILDVNGSANDVIYNILTDATGVQKSSLKIGNLTGLNLDDVKLSRVLEPSTSELLYSILKDATGEADVNDITVKSLKGLSTDNIKLSTVMDINASTTKLYDILSSATGKDKESITIADLKGMDTSSIKLNTILNGAGSNELLNILATTCGVSVEDLTVGSIENDFDVAKIRIDSLNVDKENVIISALLSEEVNSEDDPVTVGNIGEKINSLRLNQLFNVQCFTKDVHITSSSPVVYKKTENNHLATYTLYKGTDVPTEDNDLYYIANNSGVWLFLLFDYSGDGGEGLAEVYSEKNTTFVGLETSFITSSQEMTNAKIRQFYDAGLLGFERDFSKIYDMTVNEVINQAADTAEKVTNAGA